MPDHDDRPLRLEGGETSVLVYLHEVGFLAEHGSRDRMRLWAGKPGMRVGIRIFGGGGGG